MEKKASKELVEVVVGRKTDWLPAGWKHGDVIDLPINMVEPNPWNPNEMTADQFNMLSENMDEVDFLDPLLVVPLPSGRFQIIDGEHRYEAQRLRDVEFIKCVLCDPLRIPEAKRKFQTVRMNQRGHLNQKKFNALVKEIMQSGEYTYDQVAHEFGFADESEFEKLIEHTRESLPTDEMKKDFDKAKGEIKTVDDLSAVLNNLFTRYGSTLPYNFMVLDFGGQKHIWVRMPPNTYKRVLAQARNCMAEGVTFDSVISLLITLLDAKKMVEKWGDKLEKPKVGEDVPGIDLLTPSEEAA